MQLRNYNFTMPMSFDEWLTRQAKLHQRSKADELRAILDDAMKASEAMGEPEL